MSDPAKPVPPPSRTPITGVPVKRSRAEESNSRRGKPCPAFRRLTAFISAVGLGIRKHCTGRTGRPPGSADCLRGEPPAAGRTRRRHARPADRVCGQTPRAARGRPVRHDVQAAEGAAGRGEGHRGEDTLPPAEAKASLTNFGGVDRMKTLENMEIFESWAETRLSCDNRIPFQFASVELNDSTREIVDSVKGFLNRHKNVRVRLDSHCGTAAPDGVAAAFSHIRGLAILSSVCGSDDDDGESMRIDRSRVLVRAWGKQISEKVARLDGHRFAELAQEGRGWVEVSFLLPPSGEDGPASEDISCSAGTAVKVFQVCPSACSCFPFEIMLTETMLQGTLEQDKAGQGN
ncbi:hypothetical protein THAOC_28986 [Thalassiosira oceanica]|uniref:Uncharacterized protein n=1 Tax=Thalassiosira oceanica TaxID=159749 RepID=K0RHP5_THAOC|nr:hypothetical protein THAOC_28986 [Thalassiosira oceanica]|eukprot:EJK51809.1 hypothetical protein THAOC_28986 [Thalassiosira oceanica]